MDHPFTDNHIHDRPCYHINSISLRLTRKKNWDK